MTTVPLEQAQREFPDLIERALAGEEIVIESDEKQVRLVPIHRASAFDPAIARDRGFGALSGKLVVSPEFFEPLTDEDCGVDANRAAAP